jgi:hypothetical protein
LPPWLPTRRPRRAVQSPLPDTFHAGAIFGGPATPRPARGRSGAGGAGDTPDQGMRAAIPASARRAGARGPAPATYPAPGPVLAPPPPTGRCRHGVPCAVTLNGTRRRDAQAGREKCGAGRSGERFRVGCDVGL